jgi:hypothetical protein
MLLHRSLALLLVVVVLFNMNNYLHATKAKSFATYEIVMASHIHF